MIYKYIYIYIYISEKAMAPHSSTLTWKIPRMEESGRLQSMESLRVIHDWVTSLSIFTFMHWRRKWQPTPVFLPGESQGQQGLVGCHLWGRTESDTTKTQLSSSSSSSIAYIYMCVSVCTCVCIYIYMDFPDSSAGKESTVGETWVWSLGWEDPRRRTWQPTSVFLPRESPWSEEPGRL